MIKLLKRFARSVVFPLLNLLHLDYLFGKLSSNRNMILCFHGVVARPDLAINNRHMSAEEFDHTIRYIAKHYEVIGVEELFRAPEATTGSRKRVCLTFDDGYLNNFTTALPILEKYKVPATFYILSAGVDAPDFIIWTDLLDFILHGTKEQQVLLVNEHSFERTPKQFHCSLLGGISLSDYMKTLGPEKYDLLHKLAAEHIDLSDLKKQFPDYWKLVSREQLTVFNGSPAVTIGSHTCAHHNLSNVSEELAARELFVSSGILETIAGKQIESIAYPDGSYNDRIKDLAERSGYRYQLAVNYRVSSDAADKRILPRLGIRSGITFRSNIFNINTGFRHLGF
jgi:peptidoglycan/xylan/chitin deacetylase (PgdA/CDA1 family)